MKSSTDADDCKPLQLGARGQRRRSAPGGYARALQKVLPHAGVERREVAAGEERGVNTLESLVFWPRPSG